MCVCDKAIVKRRIINDIPVWSTWMIITLYIGYDMGLLRKHYSPRIGVIECAGWPLVMGFHASVSTVSPVKVACLGL